MEARAKVKLKDIAEKAGVAVASVSAALNDTGRIGAEARKRILKIAREMNYEPNLAAKFLKQKNRTDIGLIVSELPERIIGSGFFQPLVVSFIQQCEAKGIHCQIEYHNIRKENAVPDMFTRGFVGGILHGGYINRGIQQWTARHPEFPFVAIEEESEYSISSNFAGVTYKAAEYLVAMGHRRIGLIVGPQEYKIQKNVKIGFDRAIQDFAIDTQNGDWVEIMTMVEDSKTLHDAVDWGKRSFRSRRRPTAMISADTRVTRGLIYAAMELGLKIPADLSIISNTGQSEAEQIYPPLTSITWNFEDVIGHGIKMLRKVMTGQVVRDKKVIIEPDLVKRDTVIKI